MNGSEILADPLMVPLDSLISQIWLPEDTCDKFAERFDLTWNATLGLYLIKDDVHDRLLTQNATLSFTLSNDLRPSSPNVTIIISYGSMALELTPEYPHVANTTKYFPIKKAANSTQYTLGRAFFQHAYVIADYERRTFSVNQAVFTSNRPSQLHEIKALDGIPGSTQPPSDPTAVPVGAWVGSAVGSLCLLLLLVAAGLWMRRRRRQRKVAYPVVNTLELDEESRARSLVEAEGTLPVEMHSKTLSIVMLDSQATAIELAAEEPDELKGDWAPVELGRMSSIAPVIELKESGNEKEDNI